jgi:hypothetical protein
MLIFVLALAQVTPTPLTDVHQRDIACAVEVAIVAEWQRKGLWTGPDIQKDGKRWIGIVGARVVKESAQPRELIGYAMQQAAEERADKPVSDETRNACIVQMQTELKAVDLADAPLPKPEKSK